MNSEKTLSETLEEDMNKLNQYVDKEVIVTYVNDGKFFKENGKLEEVDPKNKINLSKGKGYNVYIPFLGYFYAIRKITDENGNKIFNNKLVKRAYKKYNDVRKKCGFTPLKPLELKQS